MNLGDSAFVRPRKRTEGRTTGAAARRVHLVVVQLLFGEDGLLVPHGDRGATGVHGGVSHPFERRFPSAASGAPSPAPAALASPGAGSVASLAWPAPLGPAVQWEGSRGWAGKAGPEAGGGPEREAGPEQGRGGAWARPGGRRRGLWRSRLRREVTSPNPADRGLLGLRCCSAL